MIRKEVKNRGSNMSFSAVILAGGRSSRFMGINKALLKIGGHTIIERVCSVLKPIFDEVIVIANKPEDFKDLEPAITIYPDAVKNRGPLSGIYTGLLKMKNDAGFFCACDMPFLNGELIRYMLDRSQSFDIVCPWNGDKYFEPLHAVYGKTCIGPIRYLLENSSLPKVRNIFPLVKTNFLHMDKVTCRTTPYDFFNINTWESFIEAVKIDKSLKN